MARHRSRTPAAGAVPRSSRRATQTLSAPLPTAPDRLPHPLAPEPPAHGTGYSGRKRRGNASGWLAVEALVPLGCDQERARGNTSVGQHLNSDRRGNHDRSRVIPVAAQATRRRLFSFRSRINRTDRIWLSPRPRHLHRSIPAPGNPRAEIPPQGSLSRAPACWCVAETPRTQRCHRPVPPSKPASLPLRLAACWRK